MSKVILDETILETPINMDRIANKAMDGVRAAFEGWKHHPSDAHMKGLRQIAKCIQDMAFRVGTFSDVATVYPSWKNDLFISSLPCGMGKTTTLVQTIKAVLQENDYKDVSFVVFLGKLDEIKSLVAKMVEDLGISKDDYSVLTSDAKLNASLGCNNPKQSRVLFTTQQMLLQRCKDKSFAKSGDFHYQGKPRDVRIWDEAILPSKILVLNRDKLQRTIGDLRKLDNELANTVDDFCVELKGYENGSYIDVPDLSAFATVEEGLAVITHEDDKPSIEALFSLQSLKARVIKDKHGSAMLQYHDILPDDLAPMLILDASGQQRKTYEYWQKHRKGIHALKSPEKSYKGFTVHHWNIGAGKTSQKRRANDIALGVAKAINDEIPANENVLVITFKPINKQPDIKQLVVDRIDRNPDRVKFTTWGRHTATNEFADCKYVILAGVLQYSTAEYEAYGLAAKAQGIDKPLTKEEFNDIRIGEISHHILQAACRGTVRKAVGDTCPPGCHLYIIYSASDGLTGEAMMQAIFPGSSYTDWKPVSRLDPRDAEFAKHLEDMVGASITKKTLREKYGGTYSRVNRKLKRIQTYFASKGLILDWDKKRVFVKRNQSKDRF